MAQLDPFVSSLGMLAGSFSMVVVGVEVDMVVLVDGEDVEAEALVLAGWAGPITCGKT